MAAIYFEGAATLSVQEDASTVETKIRKAREDRTSFVELRLTEDAGSTWINADRILRFTE